MINDFNFLFSEEQKWGVKNGRKSYINFWY
jgi:hypothetical protein